MGGTTIKAPTPWVITGAGFQLGGTDARGAAVVTQVMPSSNQLGTPDSLECKVAGNSDFSCFARACRLPPGSSCYPARAPTPGSQSACTSAAKSCDNAVETFKKYHESCKRFLLSDILSTTT